MLFCGTVGLDNSTLTNKKQTGCIGNVMFYVPYQWDINREMNRLSDDTGITTNDKVTTGL